MDGQEPVNDTLEPIKEQKESKVVVVDPTEVEPVVINLDKNLLAKEIRVQGGGQKALNALATKRTEKKQALPVEDNLNEADLSSVLTKEDHEFYKEKKQNYINHYPDLGDDPFDLDDLHLMIMEQVFQRNLLKRKKKHPNVDITKEYEASVKRQNDFKKSLNMRRADRVKNKNANGPKINIAKISMNFMDKDSLNLMQERVQKLRTEDSQLRVQGKVID